MALYGWCVVGVCWCTLLTLAHAHTRQSELLAVYRGVCEERQRLCIELQTAEKLRASVRSCVSVFHWGGVGAVLDVLEL